MPLYYTKSKDDRFIFASEIKGIFSAGVEAEIKKSDENFKYQWSNMIPLANQTVFKDIYQLIPGQLLNIDVKKQTMRIGEYYQITQPKVEYKPESYFLPQLSDLLEKSISRELTGHAKIGLSYSGGIDSTLILKMLKEKLNYTPISIAAFRDEKYFDTVREASNMFDTKLVEIVLDKKIMKEIPKTINAIETYGMGHGIELLHFNISKEAKNQGIKVLMCGAGLDEAFLGYRHFLAPIFNQNKGRQLEKKLIEERHAEIRQLYNTHLSVRDRTRMAHGIEARVPFVNLPLIEFATRIPPSYCVGKTGEVKKIMRKASLEFLPKEYAYMKKIQSYTHSNIFSIIQEELNINTNEEYLTICREILKEIFIDGKNVNSINV
jgi:asparagine synthase (glutamine-hydrolysing)